jgi:Capsular polysaccharide biosynthesis protein
MPAPPWNDRLIEALMDIKPLRGLKVILAHVERYDYNDIEALFRLGLKGQLNASAFGSFGKRRRYRGWIDDGYVIALGSDIHGEGRAYDEYLHTMNILGERGQRLQQSMHSLIYKKEIRL